MQNADGGSDRNRNRKRREFSDAIGQAWAACKVPNDKWDSVVRLNTLEALHVGALDDPILLHGHSKSVNEILLSSKRRLDYPDRDIPPLDFVPRSVSRKDRTVLKQAHEFISGLQQSADHL